MIFGVGHDLVETERVARALTEQGPRFEELVYTTGELAACAGRRDRVEALAGRFAAKEAFLKALGTGLSGGIGFRLVEVVEDGGRPALRLHGAAEDMARERGVRHIHVSLTHEAGMAAAVVILEG